MTDMRQILAGMNELKEREQNAEVQATEAERQAQATQQELERSQAGVKRKEKGAAVPQVERMGSSFSHLVWTIFWWCAGRNVRTR